VVFAMIMATTKKRALTEHEHKKISTRACECPRLFFGSPTEQHQMAAGLNVRFGH
jgi:hypothetical protein